MQVPTGEQLVHSGTKVFTIRVTASSQPAMCPPPPAVADRPRPCIGTGAAEEDLDNMAWRSCRAPQLAACLRRFVAESATLEPRALTQGVRHARRLHYRSELTRAAESSLAMGYLADWMMAQALRPRLLPLSISPPRHQIARCRSACSLPSRSSNHRARQRALHIQCSSPCGEGCSIAVQSPS